MAAEQDGEPPERFPDEQKVFVSRIPVKFSSTHVQRLIEEKIGDGRVKQVDLAIEVEKSDEKSGQAAVKEKPHKGFGFVVMNSVEEANKTIALGTLKGKRTATSKKLHTLYVGAVVHEEEGDAAKEKPLRQVCFLWGQNRCPYGEQCRFEHSGQGGCIPVQEKSEKKRQKCWKFLKGKCTDKNCPLLHVNSNNNINKPSIDSRNARPKSEKPCIDWKTKGKCRRLDTCPYAHDPDVQFRALEKIKRRSDGIKWKNRDKVAQPLSVRVFGLNYETTVKDVEAFFQSCGKIVNVDFPVWPDSGRSKGYCQVLFQSPKAPISLCQC